MTGAPERLDLEAAVARFVRDGSQVYLGNFGAQLFAAGHQLIRSGVRELRLVMSSGGILLDQLLGARVVAEVVTSHCWSPVGPAPAHNFRRLAEGGDRDVGLREVSLGVLTSALAAGAWGFPFMPTTALEGTGFAGDDWTGGLLAAATSAFGEALVARAITPDVAFVHVDSCDRDGNGILRGPRGEVALAAQAARDVVLVTEELVDPEIVRANAAAVAIPGLLVSAIVVEPFALRPDGAVGRYDRDIAAYEAYTAAAATPEGFARWLGESV
jgi:glutaconate CoA-transferase subunit A